MPSAVWKNGYDATTTDDLVVFYCSVDLCLDSSLTLFDSADIYSGGAAEEILGEAMSRFNDRFRGLRDGYYF